MVLANPTYILRVGHTVVHIYIVNTMFIVGKSPMYIIRLSHIVRGSQFSVTTTCAGTST
jgi:cytochrome bd-type quinol oxidase subunit 1